MLHNAESSSPGLTATSSAALLHCALVLIKTICKIVSANVKSKIQRPINLGIKIRSVLAMRYENIAFLCRGK